MSCETCPITKERIEDIEEKIEKLIEWKHSTIIWKEKTDDFKERVGAKLDKIEEHHRNIFEQQTKISSVVTILAGQLKNQEKDRTEKHTDIMGAIENLKTSIQSLPMLKIKMNILWGVAIFLGTGFFGLLIWLIQQVLEKGA